jgi:hypothetical protein
MHIINLYVHIVLLCSFCPVGIPAGMVYSRHEGKQFTDGKVVRRVSMAQKVYSVQKDVAVHS